MTVLYLVHSNYIPQDDGSEYVVEGHNLYQQFRVHGLWEGVREVYEDRGYRPIIFNLLMLPGYFLTGGKWHAAYDTAILLIFSYTILYAFLLLREVLSPLSASIGAALAASLPLFLFLSVYFLPEVALPGLIVGTIYHLLKSEDFSRLTHVISAAILAGLAFCIRMDGPVMMLVPLLVVVLGTLLRRRVVDFKDVLLSGFVAVFVTAIFLSKTLTTAAADLSFPTTGREGASVFLALMNRFLLLATGSLALCVPVVIGLARKTRSAGLGLLGFTLLSCLIPLIWFYPFTVRLFEWMHWATFGDWIRNAAVPPFWSNIWGLLDASGSFVIFSACIVAILGVIIRGGLARGLCAGVRENRFAGYLGASVILPLLLTLMGTFVGPAFWASSQGWRRLFGASFGCILLLAMVGLQKGRGIAARQWLAISVLLTQSVVGVIRCIAPNSASAHWRTFSGVLEPPRVAVPEPNQEVIATLNQLARTEKVTEVSVEDYTDVSVGAVYTLANVMGAGYQIRNNYIHTYSGLQELPGEAKLYSHIVISVSPPTNGAKDKILETIKRLRTGGGLFTANHKREADILELAFFGNLRSYGLELISTKVLGNSEVFFFRSLLYKPVGAAQGMGPDWMAEPDNLAASNRQARLIASNHQTGFPVSNLTDGTSAAWGSVEGLDDVYAGVEFPAPTAVHEFEISVFAPDDREHIRDISIVAADSENGNSPVWHIVRARLFGGARFSEKMTVPVVADGTVVRIDIDSTDPSWGKHRFWAIACFSGTKGYSRNYLKVGTGFYIRELGMR